MKSFSFPLESLRTLRKQRESAAQQRYARALTLCDGAARLLALANGELTAGQEMLAGELVRGTTASRILQLRTWCTVLEIRCHECQAKLTEARRAAAEAFELLTAAAREREALDKFHEKSQRLWQRECQQEEQKVFDELAVQRQGNPAMELATLN